MENDTIFIDGYDFSEDVKTFPQFESTSPEWGQIDEQLTNDIINIELPIDFKSFFDNGRDISNIPIKIYNPTNEIIFNGAITEIKYQQRELIVIAKSFTTLLFNQILTGKKFYYTREDTTAVDTIVELLDLAEEVIKKKFPNETFTLNSQSYQKAQQYQESRRILFNVYADNIIYNDLITKLCEVSCAIFYYRNGEYYFDIYEPNPASSIPLENDDFVTFPNISPQTSNNIGYNGVDVRYGNDISILDKEEEGLAQKASKTINMQIGQELEVSSRPEEGITTPQQIKDLYDSIYTNNRVHLEVDVRKVLDSLLGKNDYIKYDDNIYRIITINDNSKKQTFIRAEGIF